MEEIDEINKKHTSGIISNTMKSARSLKLIVKMTGRFLLSKKDHDIGLFETLLVQLDISQQ